MSIRLAKAAIPRLQTAEWLVVAPFGVFCFVYPFAMILLSLDLMPFGMEWMSSLLLAMLGLTAGAWLWLNYGLSGAGIGAAIFLLGLGLEYLGVSTGFPFGHYRYTGVLVPGSAGGVPLAIGFAWLFIVVGGLFTTRWLLGRFSWAGRRQAYWLVALVGAALVVGLDLLLEPVAFLVKNYWRWLEGDTGYYGVPWSNFIAWFIVAFVLNLFAGALTGNRTVRWGWIPVALYVMNVALFGVVNVAHGLWIAGIVGLVLLGACAAGMKHAST